MATESKTGAKYIDKDPPMEQSGNLPRRILDYLAYLKETLNFIFNNYGRRLVNADGDINELTRTAEETTSRLSDAEGNISTLQQTAGGLESRVEDAEGDISTLQQTAQGLTYEVFDAGSTLNTNISAVAGKVAIVIDSNDNIKAAEIVAAVNDAGSSVIISADHLDLNGYVTFTNLSTSGQTAIDGANITTGYISADRINAGTITLSKLGSDATTAISNAASAASDAQTAANGANSQEQLIYKQAVSGTNTMTGTTTWVTATGESVSSDTAGLTPVWTTKRPTYRSKYPVLFVATQRKTVGGTVTCTTPLKDDTTTIIDGGHITTGTIDASQVTVEHIDASNITTGQMSASRVNLTDYSTTSQMNAAITASETGILTTVEANAAVVNLLPNVYFREYASGKTWTNNGITWTVNPDGSITATGTATANSDYFLTQTNDTDVPRLIVDHTKKYTFSGVPNVSGTQMRVVVYNSSGTQVDTLVIGYGTAPGVSRTIPEGYYKYAPLLRVTSGTALPGGGATWYPMLVIGDTVHAYVSTHSGSYAMESQIKQNTSDITLKVSTSDYNGQTIIGKINLDPSTATIAASHINLQGAVSISSLDSSLQSSVNGIPAVNILPSIYTSDNTSGKDYTSHGIRWVTNNDGSITATATGGTRDATSYYYLTAFDATNDVPWIPVDPAKKYTASGASGVAACGMRIQRWDANKTVLGSYDLTTQGSYTTPIGASFIGVYLFVNVSANVPSGGVTWKPMLEAGDTAHAWVSTYNGSNALLKRTITNATNINTNAQAISLEAQTRAADVSGLQSNLEAEIDIRSNQIQSLVENVETLDGSITQKVATAVTQSTAGIDARITSVKQTADDTAEVIDTHFEFSTAGMKIKGTEGSSDTSFLLLAADRVSLYENDTERLWLDEDGANAQAFNATQAVRIGSFIWEEYPGGFRLIKN